MDIELDESAQTVVHHWIVTGEPGPVPGYFGGESPRFPAYRYVYSSADRRWLGDKAEAVARRFVERLQDGFAGADGWESGPFLHHRTVTYGPLEDVDVRGYGAAQLEVSAAEPLVAVGTAFCKCMSRDCPNAHYDDVRPAVS